MRLSLILRSVTATWAAVIVSAASSFFLTPYILRRLGDEAYGLWVLVVALSDYYLFLQIGVRSAIVRYVSRNHALSDRDAVNRVVVTSFYFFAAIFVFVIGIATGLHNHVAGFFSVKPQHVAAFSGLFLLIGIAQAFDFPLGVFEGSIEAIGRFDLLYGLRIVGMLLRVILIIIVLEKGGGLFGVGAATVLSTLTVRCVAIPLAFLQVEGFNLSPRGIDKKVFRELITYGSTTFFIGVAERLKNSLYPVVIAKFLCATAVTLFSLPTKLFNVPLNGIGSMTEFVSPLSSQLEARGDHAGLRRLLVLGSETSLLLFAPLAAVMIIFGKEMISLWVGNNYASTYPLLVLLVFGLGIYETQNQIQSLLFGIGRHKGLIWIRSIEVASTVALGIALMKVMGLLGYALAVLIVSVGINVFLIPNYVCGILEMSLPRYWIDAVLKPCVFSLPLVAVLLACHHVFPVQTWSSVIGASLLGLSIYLFSLMCGLVLRRLPALSWVSLDAFDVLETALREGKLGLSVSEGRVLREFEKLEAQSATK
jgi:O-antigen/teichoic acid export membrane protein